MAKIQIPISFLKRIVFEYDNNIADNWTFNPKDGNALKAHLVAVPERVQATDPLHPWLIDVESYV